MGEEFLTHLADTANTLIEMLGDCEMNVVEYVTDCVSNNGYVFIDELLEMDKEE